MFLLLSSHGKVYKHKGSRLITIRTHQNVIIRWGMFFPILLQLSAMFSLLHIVTAMARVRLKKGQGTKGIF